MVNHVTVASTMASGMGGSLVANFLAAFSYSGFNRLQWPHLVTIEKKKLVNIVKVLHIRWPWVNGLLNRVWMRKRLCIDKMNYYVILSSSKVYRRDPNKSGGGTQSFSITPYSLNGSRIFLIFCGDLYFRRIQVAPLWRFLNFHLEHP